jgi:hypothetical protein
MKGMKEMKAMKGRRARRWAAKPPAAFGRTG